MTLHFLCYLSGTTCSQKKAPARSGTPRPWPPRIALPGGLLRENARAPDQKAPTFPPALQWWLTSPTHVPARQD